MYTNATEKYSALINAKIIKVTICGQRDGINKSNVQTVCAALTMKKLVIAPVFSIRNPTPGAVTNLKQKMQ